MATNMTNVTPSGASAGHRQDGGPVQVRRTSSVLGLARSVPWPSLISLAVFFTTWEIVGQLEVFRVIPPLSEIVDAWLAVQESGRFQVLTTSAQTFGIGVGAAFVAASFTAVLTTLSRTADYVSRPYIDAFMSVPITAIVPVLMLIFGIGMTTRVVVVFLYAYFVMVINMQAGLQNVDPSFREMADAFGSTKRQVLTKVVIPNALPLVMVGVRLGVTRGLKGMVNAEVIISSAGIGWLLIRAATEFDIPTTFALTITVVIVALVIIGGITKVEKTLFRHQMPS